MSTKWCFHASTVTCLTWAPDSSSLVSGSLDDAIILWSLENKIKPKAQIQRILRLLSTSFSGPCVGAHAGAVTNVRFLDAQRFVSGGVDGCIRIWHIRGQ